MAEVRGELGAEPIVHDSDLIIPLRAIGRRRMRLFDLGDGGGGVPDYQVVEHKRELEARRLTPKPVVLYHTTPPIKSFTELVRRYSDGLSFVSDFLHWREYYKLRTLGHMYRDVVCEEARVDARCPAAQAAQLIELLDRLPPERRWALCSCFRSVLITGQLEEVLTRSFVDFLHQGLMPKLEFLALKVGPEKLHEHNAEWTLERLFRALEKRRLLHLDMDGCYMGEDGIGVLTGGDALARVEDFGLACNSLRLSGLAALRRAVEDNKLRRLRKLNLDRNELAGAKGALGQLVQQLPRLELLSLTGNDLTEEDLAYVAAGIAGDEAPRLRRDGRVVPTYYYTPASWRHMPRNENLRHLSLNGAKGSVGSVLTCLAPLRNLEVLNLEACGLDDEFMSGLVTMAFALQLTHLNLSHNHLTVDSVEHLASVALDPASRLKVFRRYTLQPKRMLQESPHLTQSPTPPGARHQRQSATRRRHTKARHAHRRIRRARGCRGLAASSARVRRRRRVPQRRRARARARGGPSASLHAAVRAHPPARSRAGVVGAVEPVRVARLQATPAPRRTHQSRVERSTPSRITR
mmetsp:Transcript_6691/g.19159  ORF Transcript_6691/g.19159 Transcript_6691/m.19159 type:complete len:578 (-) Transcript_6691:94-1827(-)